LHIAGQLSQFASQPLRHLDLPFDLQVNRRHRGNKDNAHEQTEKHHVVMRGLDPRIHHLRKSLSKNDGLPGRARQ
jgi:hypothetical protein